MPPKTTATPTEITVKSGGEVSYSISASASKLWATDSVGIIANSPNVQEEIETLHATIEQMSQTIKVTQATAECASSEVYEHKNALQELKHGIEMNDRKLDLIILKLEEVLASR